MRGIEKGRSQLYVLASIVIIVLGLAIAFFLFSLRTFVEGALVWLLNSALIVSFAALVILFVVYLLEREARLRRSSAELYQQLEQRSGDLAREVEKLSFLSRIGAQIASAKSFSALNEALEDIASFLAAEGAAVFVKGRRGDAIHVLIGYGSGASSAGARCLEKPYVRELLERIHAVLESSKRPLVYPGDLPGDVLEGLDAEVIGKLTLVSVPVVRSERLGLVGLVWWSDGARERTAGLVELIQTIFGSLELQVNNLLLGQARDDVMRSLLKLVASAVEFRDPSKIGHAVRVMQHSVAIAKAMGLSEATLRSIQIGCLLHDVGYLHVPADITNKPDRLTPDEVKLLRLHPTLGVEMLREIDFSQEVFDIIEYHHERYDGAGYPHGLSGEDIPLVARIVAVADAFDAMTSRRAYRGERTISEALSEISRQAGSQFDPKVAGVLLTQLGHAGLEMQSRVE